ncbi:Poly-beta-1,6-N-acetyl-D-glucosamine N-deacetylase precursor [compost metagenome]
MIKYTITTLLILVIGLTILSPIQAIRKQSLYYEDQVAVLMYHHVHDQDTSSGTITTQLFRDQLQFLRDKGYHFITLNEFKQYMQGANVPKNAVLVTFDDGYQSFYTQAYPILRDLLVPAVNFVITADIDDPMASYIPSMSEEQITDMTHATNYIDAQCHTDSLHYKLPNGQAALEGRVEQDGTIETEEAYKQRVSSDTNSCRQKLTKLNPQPIDSLAYPFGITNKLATSLVEQAGIKYAFTIVPSMATRDVDQLRIPRINAGSPHITPELLHHTVQRRIVARGNTTMSVDLHQAIAQLGGTVTDVEGKLQIDLHGKIIQIKPNSKQASSDGDSIKLNDPISTTMGITTISLTDLQTLTQLNLIYNPLTQQISERLKPQNLQ